MTEAEQYHQWRYLEPEDTITVGNAKRWGLLDLPPRKPVVDVLEAQPAPLSEEEDNLKQDAYLEWAQNH